MYKKNQKNYIFIKRYINPTCQLLDNFQIPVAATLRKTFSER